MADFGKIPPISVSGGPSFKEDPDRQKAIDDFAALADLIEKEKRGEISMDQLHQQGQKLIDDLKRLSSKLPQDVQEQIGELDNVWRDWSIISPWREDSCIRACEYCTNKLNPN